MFTRDTLILSYIRGLCCGLVCLLLLYPPLAAFAQAPPPDEDQAGQWRVLARTADATTSRCVGRPATPLCAVETLLACFQRGRIDLCHLVDDNADEYAEAFASPADPERYLAYRVVSIERPAEGAGPDAGEVTVTLDQREGRLGQGIDPRLPPLSRFLLRQDGHGSWKILGWGEADQ